MRTKLLAILVRAMLRTAEGKVGFEMNIYLYLPGAFLRI
jgi:hypothetical protein